MKLLRVLLLLSLFSLDTRASQTEPQTTQSDPTAEAKALLDADKNDAALALLEGLPDPASDPRLRYLRGLAHYQKREYARAVEHFAAVAARAPKTSLEYRQSVQLLGLSRYFLGQARDAIPALEEVLAWSPRGVEIPYLLGVCYLLTHDGAKARHAFAKMFAIAPDSAAAYLLNGQMMIRQRLEELAESELRQALALDPKLPQANFLLGELMLFRAEIDRGIEHFEREIAVNPAFGMAHYMLGEAYTRQLKWDEAIAPLQKSIWLNPYFSGPYIVLGKVYLKKDDFGNAEAMLRRAVQMDPNNFSAHHLLAQVLQQSGRPAEAKVEFELAERLRSQSEAAK